MYCHEMADATILVNDPCCSYNLLLACHCAIVTVYGIGFDYCKHQLIVLQFDCNQDLRRMSRHLQSNSHML